MAIDHELQTKDLDRSRDTTSPSVANQLNTMTECLLDKSSYQMNLSNSERAGVMSYKVQPNESIKCTKGRQSKSTIKQCTNCATKSKGTESKCTKSRCTKSTTETYTKCTNNKRTDDTTRSRTKRSRTALRIVCLLGWVLLFPCCVVGFVMREPPETTDDLDTDPCWPGALLSNHRHDNDSDVDT